MSNSRAIVPISALLALLAGGAAHAQGQAQAPMKPDGEWRGSINAGLSFASGNTDSTDINASGNVGRATDRDNVNFYLTTLYGTKKTDGQKNETANLFRAGGKYDRNLTDRVFAFGSLDTEHDKLQELDLRAVAAAGLGYYLVKNQNNQFDVFSGLAYNHERFTTETRSSPELLLGEESSHKISETTSLKQRFAIYPNLSEGGEYRAQFDAGLVTSITRKIDLKLTLSNRYMSDPQPGVKSLDTLFLTSIGYRFGPD